MMTITNKFRYNVRTGWRCCNQGAINSKLRWTKWTRQMALPARGMLPTQQIDSSRVLTGLLGVTGRAWTKPIWWWVAPYETMTKNSNMSIEWKQNSREAYKRLANMNGIETIISNCDGIWLEECLLRSQLKLPQWAYDSRNDCHVNNKVNALERTDIKLPSGSQKDCTRSTTSRASPMP